jgi:hypothetical protein
MGGEDGSPAPERKPFGRLRTRTLGALDKGGYGSMGGFAALLAGVMLMYFVPWPEGATTVSGRRGSDRKLETATEQRQIAAGACREQNWAECERGLDLAAVLDPEGDRAADVKALRDAIAAGLRGKTGTANGAPATP